MIPYKIAMVVEFRHVLGKNPYDYLGSGKYYLEYEITEILFDAYEFYKLGDKIKVYQNAITELNAQVSFTKNLFLTMHNKYIYDRLRFKNSEIEKEIVPIMLDLYSTSFYTNLKDSIDALGIHNPEELRAIYKDAKKAKKDKSEALYWYDCDFELLLEKNDDNLDIKDSK